MKIPFALSILRVPTLFYEDIVNGQEYPLQNIGFSSLYNAQTYPVKSGQIHIAAYLLVNERFWKNVGSGWDGVKTLFGSILSAEEFEKTTRPVYNAMFDCLGPWIHK